MLHRPSHWFIPTKLNKHSPYALRPIGLFIMVVVLAFIPSIYNFTAHGSMQVLGYATSISVGDLNAISNTQRTNNGLAALSLNNQLNQAAQAKAQHMFANDYWAHNAPDGTTPWSFINNAGFAYVSAGENLAKNFSTSAGVVDGWMNSAGHRANILNGSFDSVGYAAVNGTLQGTELTLVVAMYGQSYVAPAPAPAPAPTPAPAPATTQKTTTPQAQATPEATAAPEEQTATQPTEETTPAPEAVPEAVVREETMTTEKQSSDQTSGAVYPADVAGVFITAPVKAYTGLNWGQKVTIFILSVLALLFVMKHTLVWRAKRRGVKDIWLRSHPLIQATFIFVAVVVTLASGAGSVL
ncbi:MAG: CAP domain-containing protein [Patescibacteria group bacterium]